MRWLILSWGAGANRVESSDIALLIMFQMEACPSESRLIRNPLQLDLKLPLPKS